MRTASLATILLLASASASATANADAPPDEGAFLGVGLERSSDAMCAALGRGPGCGVLVGDVSAGSPAQQAGLRVGDLIVKLDGRRVDRPDDLMDRMDALRPGHRVTIDVLRQGKWQKVAVTLGKREGHGSWSRWRDRARGWVPRGELDRMLRRLPRDGFSPGWGAPPELEKRMRKLERQMEQLRQRLGGAKGSKTSA